MPHTIAALLRAVATQLADAGVPDPLVDAEMLAGHVLGRTRGEVQAAVVRGDAVDDADAARLQVLAQRRAAREPLQHLTGVAAFRHLAP